MNRREFVCFLGTSAAIWPRNVRAQQSSKKTWHVGVVHSRDDEADRRDRALDEHLTNLGYVQGREITISVRAVVPSPKNYEDAMQACFRISTSWLSGALWVRLLREECVRLCQRSSYRWVRQSTLASLKALPVLAEI